MTPFLSGFTDFCSMVIHGDVPAEVRPLFFGASLVALCNKMGGVCTIAVGCTLCSLVVRLLADCLEMRWYPF